MITFGMKLRVMRALFNIRQSDLAQQTHLARRDIVLFEKDRALPTPQSQQAIEAVFNIKFDAPRVENAFHILAGHDSTDDTSQESAA